MPRYTNSARGSSRYSSTRPVLAVSHGQWALHARHVHAGRRGVWSPPGPGGGTVRFRVTTVPISAPGVDAGCLSRGELSGATPVVTRVGGPRGPLIRGPRPSRRWQSVRGHLGKRRARIGAIRKPGGYGRYRGRRRQRVWQRQRRYVAGAAPPHAAPAVPPETPPVSSVSSPSESHLDHPSVRPAWIWRCGPPRSSGGRSPPTGTARGKIGGINFAGRFWLLRLPSTLD